ncbi:MAG: glutathione peroxidase [Rickettsiales bacterium]|nr:glutathione peroxidase [Rickettsiales bacterium]
MKLLSKLFAICAALFSFQTLAEDGGAPSKNAHNFTFQTLLGGEKIPLSNYKGKLLLIVNTASKCGFTGQYEGLEKLYKTYKERGLIVIGVPSNDFGAQEPGSSEKIAEFCQLNYGVNFPMTQKEAVSGKDAHPFYRWAKKELGFGTAPKWNFHKYLVNQNGELIDYFNSTTKPQSSNITKAIEIALNEGA